MQHRSSDTDLYLTFEASSGAFAFDFNFLAFHRRRLCQRIMFLFIRIGIVQVAIVVGLPKSRLSDLLAGVTVCGVSKVSDCSKSVRLQQKCQTAAKVSGCSKSVRLQQKCQTAAKVSGCSKSVRLQQKCQAAAKVSDCSKSVRLQQKCQTTAIDYL